MEAVSSLCVAARQARLVALLAFALVIALVLVGAVLLTGTIVPADDPLLVAPFRWRDPYV